MRLIVEADDIGTILTIKRLKKLPETRGIFNEFKAKRFIRKLDWEARRLLVRAMAEDFGLTDKERFELARAFAITRENLHKSYPDPADEPAPRAAATPASIDAEKHPRRPLSPMERALGVFLEPYETFNGVSVNQDAVVAEETVREAIKRFYDKGYMPCFSCGGHPDKSKPTYIQLREMLNPSVVEALKKSLPDITLEYKDNGIWFNRDNLTDKQVIKIWNRIIDLLPERKRTVKCACVPECNNFIKKFDIPPFNLFPVDSTTYGSTNILEVMGVPELPYINQFLSEVNGIVLKGIEAHKIPDNARILLSETLFSRDDAEHLRGLLREGSLVKIASPKEIRSASTNATASKENLVCVIKAEDYDNKELWNGSHKNQVRAGLIILKEDLQGSRYLHLEAVAGLAHAIMADDTDRARSFLSIIFDRTSDMDDAALLQCLIDDPRGFADKVRFKRIAPFDDDELLRDYKIKVEGLLVMA